MVQQRSNLMRNSCFPFLSPEHSNAHLLLLLNVQFAWQLFNWAIFSSLLSSSIVDSSGSLHVSCQFNNNNNDDDAAAHHDNSNGKLLSFGLLCLYNQIIKIEWTHIRIQAKKVYLMEKYYTLKRFFILIIFPCGLL